MPDVKQLALRSEVNPDDTWDLSSLFPSDDAWETAFAAWEARIGEYAVFQGKLGESPESLAACLQFDLDLDRVAERLGNYAFLKTAEDVGQSTYQRMQGRYLNVASRASQAASFIRPEILAIPDATMKTFLESAVLAPYRLLLQRVLRYLPHTLGPKEEHLLAMQTEMAQAASQIFRQLNDADLKFGNVTNHQGQVVELSHATFSALLYSPDRSVRRETFHQYYREYSDHSHTLAASLFGSIQTNIYYARARNYPQRPAGGLVSRPGAGDGLRQSHRVGPPSPAGALPLLRRAAAENGPGRHPSLRHLRADPRRLAAPPPLGRGGRGGAPRAGAARQRIRRGTGERAPRPLVRPLREPQQAERGLQFRHLRRRSVYPDELPAGRAGPRLHAGPRGGPFHAQLAFCPASAVRVLQLRDLRGRGGQYVQRAATQRLFAEKRGQRSRTGLSHQPAARCDTHDHLPPDDVRRVRETDPRIGRVGRTAHAGTVRAKSTAACSRSISARSSSSTTS